MTENKGDLISREALKKKLQEHHDFFVNAWGGFKNLPPNDKARVDEITHCISEVVNASTVEPPNQLVLRARDDAELEQLKTAWGNGEICFTPIVAYTARPQGDITEEQAIDKLHETGWLPEHDRQMTERPQGEWIIVKSPLSTETIVKCPYCKDEFIGNGVEDYNFCPICGAQMKRGGET